MSQFDQSRRDFLKTATVAASTGALATTLSLDSKAGTPATNPAIKVAGYNYDRVRGIMDGNVGIDGATVSFHYEDIYAVNEYAFGPSPEYEVSELGLIPYVNKFINEDFRAYTLIPVFISRIFRHRNIFVHTDSGIKTPQDLRGKRVGTPGYGMSANTWIRGFLLDEYGVAADDFEWIETTKSSDEGNLDGSAWDAFKEDGSSKYFFREDFPIKQGPPGVDESELLLNGDCDAVITAITPKSFLEGNPAIKRLFPDFRAVEQDYFRKTGLFPIMHVVGIRTDAIKANPGLPMAVFDMYQKAKLMAYADLETTTSLKVSLPWVTQEFEETVRLMGEDYWRYGIEANRKELDLVMRYTHEQGLVKQRMEFSEMFHPSTLGT